MEERYQFFKRFMLILESPQLTSDIPDQSDKNVTTSDQRLVESNSCVMKLDQISMESTPSVIELDQCLVESGPNVTKLNQILKESLQSEMQPRLSVIESVESMLDPVASAMESVPSVMGSSLNANWIPAMATPLNAYLMAIDQQGVQRTINLRSCYDGRYMYTFSGCQNWTTT